MGGLCPNMMGHCHQSYTQAWGRPEESCGSLWIGAIFHTQGSLGWRALYVELDTLGFSTN